MIVSFLWQEHQALNEKSESLITTDDKSESSMTTDDKSESPMITDIEITMNSHHWQQLYFRQERQFTLLRQSLHLHTFFNVRLAAGQAQN